VATKRSGGLFEVADTGGWPPIRQLYTLGYPVAFGALFPGRRRFVALALVSLGPGEKLPAAFDALREASVVSRPKADAAKMPSRARTWRLD